MFTHEAWWPLLLIDIKKDRLKEPIYFLFLVPLTGNLTRFASTGGQPPMASRLCVTLTLPRF
jgi:hypothetical protein